MAVNQRHISQNDFRKENVRKSVTGNGPHSEIDIVIHKDTLVMEGYGKAVVCAVGDYEKTIPIKKKKVTKTVGDKNEKGDD